LGWGYESDKVSESITPQVEQLNDWPTQPATDAFNTGLLSHAKRRFYNAPGYAKICDVSLHSSIY